MYFFAIIVFILAFVSLYTASISDVGWFKAGIATVFSVLVSMLVTFNIFR